ncbi:unnamed protein product, partial [Ectocarpus fasciculatus]
PKRSAPTGITACTYLVRHALNLGSAKTGSDTSPCTNIVLKCLFC